jgi:O-antigen/teichoic acid export membrane protein
MNWRDVLPSRARVVPSGAFSPNRWRGLLSRRAMSVAVWGVGDQALASGTNFLTMVILARALSKSDLGAYVLVFAGLQLVLTFQGSLISQPHNVIGVRYQGEDYKTYSTSCLFMQLVLVALTVAVFLILGSIFMALGLSVWVLLFCMALAAPSWKIQDFFRRIMYTEGRAGAAFANDLISYGSQAFLIIMLFEMGRLTSANAIIVLGLTSLLATLVALVQLKNTFNWRVERRFIRENWLFGRWLLGSAATGWVNTQAYRYMIALLLGSAATGTLAAVEIILRPIGIVVTTLDTMLPTFWARQMMGAAGSSGGHFNRSRFLLPLVATAPFVVLYALIVPLLGDRILDVLYNGTYENQKLLITLIAFQQLISFGNSFLGSMLRVLDATSTMFLTSIIACTLTLTLGWLWIGIFSIEGAVIGGMINSFIFAFISGKKIRQEMARRSSTVVVA